MVSSFSPKMALILAFTSNKSNRLKNPAIRSYRPAPYNRVARKSFSGLRREELRWIIHCHHSKIQVAETADIIYS